MKASNFLISISGLRAYSMIDASPGLPYNSWQVIPNLQRIRMQLKPYHTYLPAIRTYQGSWFETCLVPAMPAPLQIYGIVHAKRYYFAASRLAAFLPASGRLLDLGGFPGSMVRLFKEIYFKDLGLEYAIAGLPCAQAEPEAAKLLRAHPHLQIDRRLQGSVAEVLKRLGIHFLQCELDPFLSHPAPLPTCIPAAEASFDAVTCLEVLEHLYTPMHTVREAFRVLKPGGIALFMTDNITNWRGLARMLLNRSPLGTDLSATILLRETLDDWRGHVRFYSAQELLTLFVQAGFVVKARGWLDIYHCNWELAKPRWPQHFRNALEKVLSLCLPRRQNHLYFLLQKPLV
jgi:SAM-dependent methyltransferase